MALVVPVMYPSCRVLCLHARTLAFFLHELKDRFDIMKAVLLMNRSERSQSAKIKPVQLSSGVWLWRFFFLFFSSIPSTFGYRENNHRVERLFLFFRRYQRRYLLTENLGHISSNMCSVR